MVVQSCILCYLLGFGNVWKNIFYKDPLIFRFLKQYTGFTQATTQLLTVDIRWVIGEPSVFKTKIKYPFFVIFF